jgi:hypothetical protein
VDECGDCPKTRKAEEPCRGQAALFFRAKLGLGSHTSRGALPFPGAETLLARLSKGDDTTDFALPAARGRNAAGAAQQGR